MTVAGMPGLQVAVVRRDGIVWHGSYGSSVLNPPGPLRPMRDDSILLIGSASKLLVPIAVMQQVERGRVSLDDDIDKSVPFPVRNPRWPGVPITWRMLLTHTSSLAGEDDVDVDLIDNYGKDSSVAFDDYVKNSFEERGRYYTPKRFRPGRPGTERIYSDDGISLAAFALERVVHQSFDAYVNNEILQPLKMQDTSYFLAGRQPGRLAVSYGVERNVDGHDTYIPSRAFWDHQSSSGSVMDHQLSFPDYPSGRIYTTASDYARLMMMFLNDGTLDGARILSPSSVTTMLTWSGFWNVDGWRQGLGVAGPKDLRGRQVWGHDGQERGYASAFYFSPAARVGALAFSNGNYKDFTMNYQLLDLDLHLMSCFERQ
jgi:CubicO group peptidase (beta-lactamase class C family)